MKFNAKKHVYTHKNEEYISVTTLINSYFGKFDANAVAKKLASFPQNKKLKRGVKYWKALWKKQQEYGTAVHKDMDNLIKIGDKPFYPESKHAWDWLMTYTRPLDEPHMVSELLLYNEEYELAGTCDLVIFENDRQVHIIDWKVTKEIVKVNKYGAPDSILGLADTNFFKYALQLNMYAYLLKADGYKVKELMIAQLTDRGVKPYQVEAMFDIIGVILENRKKELEERK